MKSYMEFGFFIILLLNSCTKEEEYAVQRKDLVQAVYASGEVLPVNFYEVTCKIPGVVDTIYVSIGQRIHAGDPLAKIQSQANQLNLETAHNLFQLAERSALRGSEQLTSLEQKAASAHVNFFQDSLEYERHRRLNQQGVGSQQTFEQAMLRYRTSKSNYIIAKTNFREARVRLQIEMQNARNNYLAQKSLLGDYTLIAAISGKVYDIRAKAGEFVNSNLPIIELGATDSFEVELRVDETDIILVKRGQWVFYKLDAVEDTVFRGKIKDIYPRVNPVDKSAKVLATIDVINYDLYPGMSLEANIIVEEKKRILVVPVEYISMDETVVVKNGTKRETVKVKVGIKDLNYAEILGGLEENDHIIKP